MNEMHTTNVRSIEPEGPPVAVVGAGLAGLSAAVELLRRGRPVVVHDARSEIGGRARTATDAGFLLNEGPHALYRTGEAYGFLQREGLAPTGGQPPTSAAVGVDDQLVGPLPADAWRLLRTPLLRRERLRFGRVLAGLGRLDTEPLRAVSTADAVHRMLGDGRGAAILHSLLRVATYGNDPEALSAGAALDQLRASLATPVLYVDGGWGSIVESMRDRVVALGGRIVAGTKVVAVTEREDDVEVATGAGSSMFDAVVIAAGGPRQVAALTGVDPAPFARPSTVAVLDVGLRGPWGDHPTFATGLDEPLYLSVHAPVARLAPEGQCLVGVMRYHPFGEPTDAGHDRAVMERLLDRVRPGWRDDADHVGFRARLVATHDQPQAARGGLAGRAPVTLEGHDRVMLAGDWVGAEGLLADACVASATTAAATIATHAAVTA